MHTHFLWPGSQSSVSTNKLLSAEGKGSSRSPAAPGVGVFADLVAAWRAAQQSCHQPVSTAGLGYPPLLTCQYIFIGKSQAQNVPKSTQITNFQQGFHKRERREMESSHLPVQYGSETQRLSSLLEALLQWAVSSTVILTHAGSNDNDRKERSK